MKRTNLMHKKLLLPIKAKRNTKKEGQVFTPSFIVITMLDCCDYTGNNILKKHIIDNSCGNGAFLKEVVKRYCYHFNGDKDTLKNELETYIHGIELDKDIYEECLFNLNNVVKTYGIENVHWDILNGNTLNIHNFDNKMDFVVGNPPYVRIHNLEEYEKVKTFSFASKGMIDLYIIFFEIGFNMLNDNGKMCIITPTSWFHSKAGNILRQHIQYYRNLLKIIDLEHYQPFGSTTYTAISLFQKNKSNEVISYSTLSEKGLSETYYLSWKDFTIKGNFYFSDPSELKLLQKILSSSSCRDINVKNGFATLADDIFIGNFAYSECIKILKASTGQWKKGIFPYTTKGENIEFHNLSIDLQNYLKNNKERLTKRSIDKSAKWYSFGRRQAIQDIQKNKIAINTIIKDIKSIKLQEVKSGEGVYSGLYILSTEKYDTIKNAILSEDFIKYVTLLKKYKSGGYYTFSSKDLENYLNYKLEEKNGQFKLS